MSITGNKHSIIKTILAIGFLVNVETALADEKDSDQFIDQLNGMTRLTRLEASNSLKSDSSFNRIQMSDTVFVQKMFDHPTNDRLVTSSIIKRMSNFFNGRNRSLKTTKRTIAPSGLFRLCADKALVVCKKNLGNLSVDKDGKVLMNPQLINSIQQVNIEINNQIKPENEQPGSKDNWQVNLNSGDCEDYVLTKKTKLINQGWPSNSLLITIVDTEFGERHAVLTVSTNHGEYILDNLMNKVINVEFSKYKFISRQGVKEGFHWNTLS